MDKANQGAPPARTAVEYKVSIFDRASFPHADLPVAGIWKLWVDEQGRRCSLAAGEIYSRADAEALAKILGLRADSDWTKYGEAQVAANKVSAAPAAPSNSKEQP